MRELRIGEADGAEEYTFGSIPSLAVGADGAVFVLDGRLSAVESQSASSFRVAEAPLPYGEELRWTISRFGEFVGGNNRRTNSPHQTCVLDILFVVRYRIQRAR